jgi:hypothetical protein
VLEAGAALGDGDGEAGTGDAVLPLLRGRKVLLVEPNDMVRGAASSCVWVLGDAGAGDGAGGEGGLAATCGHASFSGHFLLCSEHVARVKDSAAQACI